VGKGALLRAVPTLTRNTPYSNSGRFESHIPLSSPGLSRRPRSL